MKFIIGIVFIATQLACSVGIADSNTSQALLRLAKAIGIYEQIEQQKMAMQSVGADAAQQYTAQIVDSFSENIPEKFAKDMEVLAADYMVKVSNIIDTELAVSVYLDLISPKLSSSEVVGITEFYESDLGKKFTQTTTDITGRWVTTISNDMQQKVSLYLQEYIDALAEKASEY